MPHSFKDAEKRTWTVQLDVHNLRKVRNVLGVDLVSLLSGGMESLGKFLEDPIGLVDVLYLLCSETPGNPTVTDEQFGRSLSGDILGSAADAFVEALIDFFPDPSRRARIRKVIEAGRGIAERLTRAADKELESLDLDQAAKLLLASGMQSTSAPASSESIQVP